MLTTCYSPAIAHATQRPHILPALQPQPHSGQLKIRSQPRTLAEMLLLFASLGRGWGWRDVMSGLVTLCGAFSYILFAIALLGA